MTMGQSVVVRAVCHIMSGVQIVNWWFVFDHAHHSHTETKPHDVHESLAKTYHYCQSEPT